jgi:hypothetical protein
MMATSRPLPAGCPGLFCRSGRACMRIRRSLPILLGVVMVAAALTLIVELRKHAPPEPARLLPGADGFVYVNLKWARRANLTGQLPPVSHDPEYEQFIQATGFQFERDLEQAAFAVHYPASSPGAISDAAAQARFSEVFVAKIEGERVRAYLSKISSSVEPYRSVDIYNIPLEGRTLRVAILGVDTVAASNHSDPLVIRGIIDRSRKLASPFGGPALLRQYYKEVPVVSLAWAIFRVDPSSGSPASSSSASASSPASHTLPGTSALSFLFSKPAVVVASARYLGTVHLRAEAFAANEQDAKRVAEQLSTFLSLFHAAENTVSAQGTDAEVKALFAGLKVGQYRNRAVLSATLPAGFIRKALGEPLQGTPVTPGNKTPSQN